MISNWTDAIHRYDPDETGRCRGGWTNDAGEAVSCGSSQRSSVLHDDPEADFRQRHDHGGGDCMCFEDDPRGFYGAMREYVASVR